jgi:RiboL-PSP-HEPN
MWKILKSEVSDRFAAADSFFHSTRKLGKTCEQTSKGLAFVQIYGAYEFAVRATVRTAVDTICAHKHKNHHLRPSLLALFLDSELKSFKDSSRSAIWSARIKIFEKLFSNSEAWVHSSAFPDDGNHYRAKHLKTIFDVFGINRSPAHRPRHLVRIDEIVDNRNAIAHGHETAAQVGSRYTRADVTAISRQARSVCLLIISVIERQCVNKHRHCRKI